MRKLNVKVVAKNNDEKVYDCDFIKIGTTKQFVKETDNVILIKMGIMFNGIPIEMFFPKSKVYLYFNNRFCYNEHDVYVQLQFLKTKGIGWYINTLKDADVISLFSEKVKNLISAKDIL